MNRDLDFLANGEERLCSLSRHPTRSLTPSPSSIPPPARRPADIAQTLLSPRSLVDCLARLDVHRMDAAGAPRGRLFRSAPSRRATSPFRREVYYMHWSVRHSLPVYCPSFVPSAPRSFGYILMPRVSIPLSNLFKWARGSCQPTDRTGCADVGDAKPSGPRPHRKASPNPLSVCCLLFQLTKLDHSLEFDVCWIPRPHAPAGWCSSFAKVPAAGKSMPSGIFSTFRQH